MADSGGRVSAVPYQKPGLPESVGLTREQCQREAWAIVRDGGRHQGGAALFAALATASGLRPLAQLYYLPGLHQLGNAVYAWVAASRRHFPGVKPYCEQRPEECGE